MTVCRKPPEHCKAKVKCKCCKITLDKDKEHDKVTLDEVDNQFDQQHCIIEIKGD